MTPEPAVDQLVNRLSVGTSGFGNARLASPMSSARVAPGCLLPPRIGDCRSTSKNRAVRSRLRLRHRASVRLDDL